MKDSDKDIATRFNWKPNLLTSSELGICHVMPPSEIGQIYVLHNFFVQSLKSLIIVVRYIYSQNMEWL